MAAAGGAGDALFEGPGAGEGFGEGVGDVGEDFGHASDDGVGVLAGEEFVEDDAEGVDIGADVDEVGVAAGLFGGHVREGSHELAGDGDEGVGGFGDLLGEAKVEDADVAGVVDEDVGGLEIAVHDALLVGVVDGFADDGEEGEGLLEGEFVLLNEGGDGQSSDIVHGVVEVSIGGDAAVEDGDDVGMAEGGDELDFAFEAVPCGTGGVGGIEEDLDGDLAAWGVLDGLVDDALAALANAFEDGVALDDGEAGGAIEEGVEVDGLGLDGGSGGGIENRIGRGDGGTCGGGGDAVVELGKQVGPGGAEFFGRAGAGGLLPACEELVDGGWRLVHEKASPQAGMRLGEKRCRHCGGTGRRIQEKKERVGSGFSGEDVEGVEGGEVGGGEGFGGAFGGEGVGGDAGDEGLVLDVLEGDVGFEGGEGGVEAFGFDVEGAFGFAELVGGGEEVEEGEGGGVAGGAVES